ncbi:MAG: Asp-tRNA(Asn)/Glu-tRNA(Gln) amidotransferase subunit GatA, partial [Candidatus Dadabacteria bacterium]
MEEFKTLITLRDKLSKKEISPLEAVEFFFSRIKKADLLNIFLEQFEEESKERAKKLESSSSSNNLPLYGVPIAIKDNIATLEGFTTCGSKMLAGYSSPYDATVISKLKEAGAVIIGKTNMDEFAMGSSNENSAFGPVRNPWDLERVPGGSSGGSAAAVSARLAAAALGSDTGGSIRQPAGFCGVTGLKPTYGRVSRWGLVAFASSLDQIGPIGVSAKDCALVLSVIAGWDKNDATSVQKPVADFPNELTTNLSGLTLGIAEEFFPKELDSSIYKSIEEAKELFKKLGVKIKKVSLPHIKYATADYY